MSAAVRLFESAAALQQTPAAQVPSVPVDTVVVESPLPGGLAQVFRFAFNNVPSWLQIGAGVVVAIVVGLLLLKAVRQRTAIAGWFAAQSGPVRTALIAIGTLLFVSAAAGGTITWRYTQHDNAFCTGCHVMNPAFHRFSQPSNKHGKLSCHNCHQQSMYASMRQVYLWVAERPEKIGPHSKVPNKVCMTCHVTGDTAKWRHIASTAGHRVHLESDSSALKNVQCVTCHGQEVHRFKPVDKTCGQSGCHDLTKKEIVLGKMATQTVRHCTACHGFTVDVPALATRDSARGTLVPGKQQCLGCHEMQAVLADFNEKMDPHGGKCGSCHDPHKQKTPAEAASSCANAGCHTNWRDNPFHAGTNHKRVTERAQCITCHVPHHAKTDASDCQGCHEKVKARGGTLRPPLRFDTAAALRKSALPRKDTLTAPPQSENNARAPSGDDALMTPGDGEMAPGDAISFAVAPSSRPSVVSSSRKPETAARDPSRVRDTIPHARHVSIPCLTCHETGVGHGRLTFEPPRGCALCHHQSPGEAKCQNCHHIERFGQPIKKTITITVPGHAAKPRDVTFLHARHAARPCIECHTTPVTMAPGPTKVTCTDCHSEHHTVERTCTSCHNLDDPRTEHAPQIAHRQCDACHTRTSIEHLTPTRNMCSTCHTAKRAGHYEPRECTVCHFFAEPAAYRLQLLKPVSR